MTAHHYTKTEVETAAAAVNAGTCLEDANFEKNVFSYIGEAVKQVCLLLYVLACMCACECVCLHACVRVCSVRYAVCGGGSRWATFSCAFQLMFKIS